MAEISERYDSPEISGSEVDTSSNIEPSPEVESANSSELNCYDDGSQLQDDTSVNDTEVDDVDSDAWNDSLENNVENDIPLNSEIEGEAFYLDDDPEDSKDDSDLECGMDDLREQELDDNLDESESPFENEDEVEKVDEDLDDNEHELEAVEENIEDNAEALEPDEETSEDNAEALEEEEEMPEDNAEAPEEEEKMLEDANETYDDGEEKNDNPITDSGNNVRESEKLGESLDHVNDKPLEPNDDLDTLRYKAYASEAAPLNSNEKAKFNSKNYEREIEIKGRTAYEDAIAKGKSEAEANYAKHKAEVSMRQRKDSSAIYSDETRILKHAEAKANEAKRNVAESGGNERQQARAYNKAFEKTYAYDNKYDESRLMKRADENGEKARAELVKKYELDDKNKTPLTKEVQNVRDEQLARAYNDAFEKTYSEARTDYSKQKPTAEDLNGRTVNQIKPGTKYFEIYDNQRNSESSIWHGEMVPQKLSAVSSEPGAASKVYLSEKDNASPKRDRAEKALPNSNTGKYREYVKINPTNASGTNVYAMESNVGAQLHQQKIRGSAFEKNDSKDPDLIGGAKQFVLTTDGKYDGSVEKLDMSPSSEIMSAKKDYINSLEDRGADFSEQEIDRQSGKIQKVDGDLLNEARADFGREKNAIIGDWEKLHGTEWPRYENDILNDRGVVIRKAGDCYDAHHIQPLSMGGRNTAENITPLHINNHIGDNGIHNTDSYRKLSNLVSDKNTDNS